MFSHRSFLVLGGDGAADIVSLMKGGFEVSNCHFSFQQGTDRTGRVSTRVFAGSIHAVLPQLPPQDILEWSMQPRKYHDGVIVLVDAENVPLEKVFFKNAACIRMKIEYTQQDTLNDAYGTYFLAYGYQMEHPTWKHTTSEYKKDTRDSFHTFYNKSRNNGKVKKTHSWLEEQGLFEPYYRGRERDSVFYENSIAPLLQDTSIMKGWREDIMGLSKLPPEE